jgi:hypothetical protein
MNPKDFYQQDEMQNLALDLFELAVELSDMEEAKAIIARIMDMPND